MNRKLSFKTRITLHSMDDFTGHGFGRGIELLLLGVDEYGSLNRAAKELGMAYSKAWNIIRENEREFALKLINRNGAHGSELTEEGRVFLNHYQEMVAAATAGAQSVFDKYYD
jgi:molybdate transport system regulatory protein